MKTQYKLKAVSAAVVLGLAAAAVAGSASAQVVVGGGATLPEKLYRGEPSNRLLPTDFSYTGTGSGAGKAAFLSNNPQATAGKEFRNETVTSRPIWPTTQSVHFAGSDSVLSTAENLVYTTTKKASWGPLIQIPAVATSVTIPFNKAGTTNVSLSRDSICKIFAGVYTTWDSLPTAERGTRTGDLRVVYRDESSGTTELLTRYLTNTCGDENDPINLSTSTLKGGKFSTVSEFKKLFVNDAAPGIFAKATGSGGMVTVVNAVEGRIGYVSPDYTSADLNNGLKVAAVANASNAKVAPTVANVGLALGSVTPPAGADRANPLKWVPTFETVPTAGYPIVGYTNLLVNQCYLDGAVETKVKNFITDLVAVAVAPATETAVDAKIKAHSFIPLPNNFKNAIRTAFVTGDTANLNFGNTTACGAGTAKIGRPLSN